MSIFLKFSLGMLLSVVLLSDIYAQTVERAYGATDCVGSEQTFYLSGCSDCIINHWGIPGTYQILSGGGTSGTVRLKWTAPISQAHVEVWFTQNGAYTYRPSATYNIVNPATTSVSLSRSPSTAIASGTNVTFTATPGSNGGSAPRYQWMVNGISQPGNTTKTFSSSTLQNGDEVFVYMTSNAQCVSPAIVKSNVITMNVTYPVNSPDVTDVPADYNSSVRLTASGAGTDEVYRWYDVQSGGTPLNTANNYYYDTDVLLDNKTYYVSKYNTANQTESGRVAQKVTVIVPPPNVPTLSTNTCGDKTLTINGTSPTNVKWYWQGTNANGTSSANNSPTYTVTDASDQTYYIKAKATTANIWSTPVGIKVTTDPVNLVVTSYQTQNQLIQASHKITLSPGFSVSAGNQFTGRIAITSECNDIYNWSEQIGYDETGKPVARSRSYSTGLGELMQSQSFDYANNKIWVSQPLYDNQKNASATTLPAPIQENDFLLKKKFVTNKSGQPYSANDFDKPIVNGSAGEILNPNSVGNTMAGSLGWYYSSNNTLEPLTPTTNYPYARSYTPPGPDPTNTRSAGPGDQYRMGSNHDVSNTRELIQVNELKHYYAIRSLMKIGKNPDMVSVAPMGYKYIYQDANGKQAVVFVDWDGRKLASARITATAYSNGSPVYTYSNWSYTYYNDIGQVVATVPPKGVDTNNPSEIPSYVTYYNYDQLGRLIETTSPDQGTSRFVYSNDGKIRFSENEQQRALKKFSYSNYDYLGRLVESGEYTSNETSGYIFQPHTEPIPASNSVLRLTENNLGYKQIAGPIATGSYVGVSERLDPQGCSDHTYIIYDFPDANIPTSDVAHSKQKNVRGRISYTMNEVATTWYSYNEFGQVEWTMQKINGLSVYQTVDYTYDYMGNVTSIAYQKGKAGQFFHYYEYDQNQRLTKVYTSVNGTVKKQEAVYYYYLHGPLKRIELANNLQGIDYVYNIDGSLKQINHSDPNLDPGLDGISGDNANFMKDVFGESLDYNANDYSGAGYNDGTLSLNSSYTDQFGGALKAIRWHNHVDGHQSRIYAFTYDNLYQMDNADFGNVSGVASNYNAVIDPAKAYMEDIVGYDANGNIGGLVRKGKTGNTIAKYKYNYQDKTNRLSTVTNNDNSFLSYEYDKVGRMTTQTEGTNTANSLAVTYNVYGLVKEIKKGSSKLVTYDYDDRGDRVIKTVYDPAAPDKILKRNYYIHDADGKLLAIYEQTVFPSGPIQQIEVPIYGGSRIAVYKPLVATYFYEISDHLGNVRSVIGKPSDISFTATLEDNGTTLVTNPRKQEEAIFKNLSATAKADANMNSTPPSQYMSKPNYSAYLKWISGQAGQDASQKAVGPAISIKVEPGDNVEIEAWAKYRNNTSYSRPGITGAIASILGSTYSATTSGIDVVAKATQTFQNGLSVATAATSKGNGSDLNTLPYAYIYYLLYDRNFNFITAGWKRVTKDGGFETGNEALSAHEKLSIAPVSITEPGYMYVFVSNESENTDVWFDDIKVTNHRSSIVAGADYYPFGLPMENREIMREDYRYGYQGQYSEEEKETGWNSFELRMYDARIGRWLTIDPYGQFASPYVAMGNAPHMGTDPDGGLCCGGLMEIGTTAAEAAHLGAEALSASIRGQGMLLPAVTVLSQSAPIVTSTIFPAIANEAIVKPAKGAVNFVATFGSGLAYLYLPGTPKVYTTEGVVDWGSHESYEITKQSAQAISNEVLYSAAGSVVGETVRAVRVVRQAQNVHTAVHVVEEVVEQSTKEQMKAFSGTSKAWQSGATPNSIYTYLSSDGKAVSNYIYNADGKVIYQVDFGRHGKFLSGHGHEMSIHGNLGSGHTSHIPWNQVPPEYFKIPDGVQYSIPPGQ